MARTYVYASGRRSCVRRMALDMMHPEDDSTPAPDALERMQIGRERVGGDAAEMILDESADALIAEVMEDAA